MRHSVLLVEGQLLNQDSLERYILWRLYEGMYDTALFYTVAESIKRRHLSPLCQPGEGVMKECEKRHGL